MIRLSGNASVSFRLVMGKIAVQKLFLPDESFKKSGHVYYYSPSSGFRLPLGIQLIPAFFFPRLTPISV